MSDFEKFKSAIFGQESGNGKADTSKPNYAGALGKGQLLEKTFNGLKANGKIPANYEWTNPAHNEEAAGKYMEEAWGAGNGNPELAAAYYYGGPKAIKGGVVNTFRDLKNAKAPSTNEYAAQVVSRMGLTPTATPRSIDNAIAKGPSPAEFQAVIERGVQASILTPTNRKLWDAQLEQANFNRQIIEESRPTGFEMFGAGVDGNTQQRIVRGIQERFFAPAFEADPDFKPDLKLLPPGSDSDLIEQYSTAKSQAQAEHVLTKFGDEQIRGKALMDRGVLTGVGLSLAAEGVAPINLVAPFAAAKGLQAFGLGSMALAQQGRMAASIGASVGENLLGGTALEAVAQGLDGRWEPQDLLISLAADSLIGLGTGLWGARAVAHAERALGAAAAESVARDADYVARASAQFGPNANAEELRKAADVLFAKDTSDLVRDALSNPVVERKLIQEEPELTAFDAPSKFADPKNEVKVAREITGDTQFKEMADLGVFKHTDDFADRKAQLDALDATPGIHLAEGLKGNLVYSRYAKAIERLRQQLIPEVSIHFTDGGTGLGDNIGVQGIIKPGVSMIAVKPGAGMRIVIHEFAHAVFAHRLAKATPEERAAMVADWKQWQDDLFNTPGKAQEAMLRRSPLASNADAKGTAIANEALEGNWKHSLANVFGLVIDDKVKLAKFQDYFSNFNEYSAEQLVKQIEAISLGEIKSKLKVPVSVLNTFKTLIQTILDVFKVAKEKKLIAPNAAFSKFFDDLVTGNKGLTSLDESLQMMQTPVTTLQGMAVPAKPADVVNEFMTDPVAVKYGLTLAPVSTPTERKQAQAMLNLYKVAEKWDAKNPRSPEYLKRVQNLADNNVFNVASSGLVMLKSENPLVRMTAATLLEDASGVTGKREATAAISKYMLERQMMANVVNDLEGAYQHWVAGRPGGLHDELIGGTNRAAYNKEVAAEIEARRKSGGPVSNDPNIVAAADTVQAAYQRIANAQREVKTLGSEGLPKTSLGYMPHKMSPKAVINLTNEQSQILHDALVDQFVTIEGWDMSFSDKLASAYMKRVRDKAAGDYSSSVGGVQGANQVEEALQGMGLPEEEVKKYMTSFNKGAANFTKGRIELDLNKVYTTAEGEFRLLDIFETDQLELVRSQAGRASGEVALTKFGVQGKPGLKLIRDALQYGETGKKAAIREVEAFDQISAEFLNEPFGNQSGKFMNRATMANTLVRLGGNGITQMAESINGIFHVGVIATMNSVGSMPRLRREILDLAAGKKVDNPLLDSIEFAGGAEFGTDSYKIVMPYDNPNSVYPTYGQDTLTLTDRLLRGGSHLQAKLSGWRAIHGTQQRGMAEQVVLKSMRYLRDGGEDKALADMGITPELAAALRKDLNKFATFGPNGKIEKLDVTKIEDPALREQYIQAVWRGTQQIIQGTFIGERGKWAHDGWLRMMTQFRGFSITSMEKQWGRKRNTHGTFAAFGMLVGSMSIAAPIYMARTYAASIGRPDQQEFLEQRLAPEAIARATLNYVALSGMSGDFLDLVTATLPEELGVKPTGGRAGVESDFVGNYVLPASSLVDDVWKYAQSPLNAEEAAKILPGSRLPYLVPFFNLAKD